MSTETSTTSKGPAPRGEGSVKEGPDPAPSIPITVEDYVERYRAEGERLQRGGVEPVAASTQYVAAFPALKAFLRQHGEALSQRGVVSAEVEAGQRLVDRLSGLLLKGGGEPREGEDRACEQAAQKLRQLRDAVRRLLRGPESASLRARLGLDRPFKAQSVTGVLRGIEQFLSVFQEQPERLMSLRLIPQDLAELSELRQRLLRQERTPPPLVDPVELLRAQLAVDAFFASLAAAIGAAFPPHDPRRSAGLKLIPRHEERRQPGPRPRLWRGAHQSPDE